MDGVLIEAQGGDRYRVNLPAGPVDVVGAEAAVRLAEGGLRALFDKAKHPRARGGRWAETPDAPHAPRAPRNRASAGATGGTAQGLRSTIAARRGPKDVPSSKLKNRAPKEVPGAPPPGKETKPQEPLGSPGRPVETDDVAQAAKELAAGRYVQLRSKNEVSTLLKELQREVQSARDKGEKAPDINLCKVTVKGTSLFCVESKGVPRVQMPQLKGDATTVKSGSKASKLKPDVRGEVSIEAQFRDHLVGHGVKVEDGEELASHLKATQNELNGAKVAGIADAIDRGVKIEGSLFVSKDNYVVDGHHRWAATVGVDYEDGKDDLKMPVQKIDMDIIDILLEANRFADEWGIPQAALGDFSKKMLAGLDGAPPPLTEKEKKVEEATRTPDGKWRARLPDGRSLDFASRELAESALGREWDKIKHPRARAGRFAETFTDNFGLPAGTPPLFSPGRAHGSVPSVSKHAMGFEPGDYLVPTRHFSVDLGRDGRTGEMQKKRFIKGQRHRVKQIIGTNQLTVEGDQPGTEVMVPTFDKTSVRREAADLPRRIASPGTHAEYPRSPGRAVGSDALGNRRVVGTPEEEAKRGERNARAKEKVAAIRAVKDANPARPDAAAREAFPSGSLVPRGGAPPYVGDRFYHAEHGPVEVVTRPDPQGTDKPEKMWIRVRDAAGKEHMVRNDTLDQEARPSRRQARARKAASKSPGRVYFPNPEGEPGMLDLPDLSPGDRLPILYDAAMDAGDPESERHSPERAKQLWKAHDAAYREAFGKDAPGAARRGAQNSPGRAGEWTPAELKAWAARENKIRGLVEQHAQADRDEDEPRRERIQRELEKLGLSVEFTGAGWMITR